MTRLRDLIRRDPRRGLSIPPWLERLLSIGIVTRDPQVARRQRGVNAAAYAGVGFGTLNLGVCTPVLTNPAATIGGELPTNTSPFVTGTYCVQVFDNPAAPTVPEPLTYSITVKHS